MEIAGSLACLGFVAEIKLCVLDRNMMRVNQTIVLAEVLISFE